MRDHSFCKFVDYHALVVCIWFLVVSEYILAAKLILIVNVELSVSKVNVS
jgi:hypothetical protein